MAAVRSCPDCPQVVTAPTLADLTQAVNLHRQLVHTGVSRNGGSSGTPGGGR